MPRPDVSWATLWLLLCPLYIGKAVHVFLDVHSVKWSKPHWMTYCMLNNLLLYLCLKGCIFKVSSSREGGGGLMFVSSGRRRGGVWWVGGVKTITTGLYQECLHRGRGQDRVCPLRNRNIFCTKVIIKAQLLLSRSLWMDDIRMQKGFFSPSFCF